MRAEDQSRAAAELTALQEAADTTRAAELEAARLAAAAELAAAVAAAKHEAQADAAADLTTKLQEVLYTCPRCTPSNPAPPRPRDSIDHPHPFFQPRILSRFCPVQLFHPSLPHTPTDDPHTMPTRRDHLLLASHHLRSGPQQMHRRDA